MESLAAEFSSANQQLLDECVARRGRILRLYEERERIEMQIMDERRVLSQMLGGRDPLPEHAAVCGCVCNCYGAWNEH